jgi:nitroreductase
MNFQKSVFDLIKKRKSIRTYKSKAVEIEKIKLLESFIDKVVKENTFKSKMRFQIVKGQKLSSIGFVNEDSNYIVGIYDKSDKNIEHFGYVFEEIFLYATELGLGTCWLGGILDRAKTAELVSLKENEIIPAITPIAYSADKKKAIDSFMRFVVAANNRKLWKEIFFENDFNTPLTHQKSDKYKEILDATRLSPSASNKQPWRVVKTQTGFDFYLKRNPGYGNGLGFDVQRLDIGIAMSHFELAAKELNFQGSWEVKQITSFAPEYISSWKIL